MVKRLYPDNDGKVITLDYDNHDEGDGSLFHGLTSFPVWDWGQKVDIAGFEPATSRFSNPALLGLGTG